MAAWLRKAFNREPAMMLAATCAAIAIAVPPLVIPARRAAGADTYQWDADVSTHPFLHSDEERDAPIPSFNDPKYLVPWSQHGTYAYDAKLVPRSYDDPQRDFPEARARLAARREAAAAAK